MPSLSTLKARDVRINRKLKTDKALKRHVENLEDELAKYREPKIKSKLKNKSIEINFD
jgi:hypothetical protein